MRKYGLYVGFLCSIAIHLSFLLLVNFSTVREEKKKIIKISLVELPNKILEKKQENKIKEEEKKQIVDLPPDYTAKKPKDSRFSSETNHETEKESVSKHRKPTDSPAHEAFPGKNKDKQPKEQQDRQEEQKPIAGPRLTDDLGRLLRKRKESPKLIPNIKDLLKIPPSRPGDPAPDAISDAPEGVGTFLNASAFKYASFFNRVKRDVSTVWRPLGELRRVDPTGKFYMYKDRKTVVAVVLDKEGYILSLSIKFSSGVDVLDEEAINAFTKCRQFPNPPLGLPVEGKIMFDFGFVVKHNGGSIFF